MLLGFLVTLTSVGAGALGAVFLLYLYPLRLSAGKLVATDIAHAIPLALFAGIGHLGFGNFDATLLGLLLMGSLPGAFVGASLAGRLSHDLLKTVLAVLLSGLGLHMLGVF